MVKRRLASRPGNIDLSASCLKTPFHPSAAGLFGIMPVLAWDIFKSSPGSLHQQCCRDRGAPKLLDKTTRPGDPWGKADSAVAISGGQAGGCLSDPCLGLHPTVPTATEPQTAYLLARANVCPTLQDACPGQRVEQESDSIIGGDRRVECGILGLGKLVPWVRWI